MEISKCFFGIFNSPKKKMKKNDFTTMVPQVELFSFIFWENWRHQKDISKLTDLYLVKGLSFSSWVVWSYSWNINVFSFSIAAASHRLLIGFLLWWIRLRIGLGCNVAILACSLRPKKNLPMTLYVLYCSWIKIFQLFKEKINISTFQSENISTSKNENISIWEDENSANFQNAIDRRRIYPWLYTL